MNRQRIGLAGPNLISIFSNLGFEFCRDVSWVVAGMHSRFCYILIQIQVLVHWRKANFGRSGERPVAGVLGGGSPLIRLKRIYNFWCSMLVFTPFALCFVTLRGIFMRFPELTYWQDATVPVPCFLLFLCFRSDTQEIFSELDETKARSLIFSGSIQTSEERKERGHRPPSHRAGAA
jgi:hypothetical protein